MKLNCFWKNYQSAIPHIYQISTISIVQIKQTNLKLKNLFNSTFDNSKLATLTNLLFEPVCLQKQWAEMCKFWTI